VASHDERSLPDLCADLADATKRLDERASEDAFRAIVQRVPTASEAELTDGVARFVPALAHVRLGHGGILAQLTAGLIESGADPTPVLGVLSERVAEGLERAARFIPVAERLGDDVAEPTNEAEMLMLREQVRAAAPAAGLSVEDAAFASEAWFTISHWIPSLLLPLQQKRGRRALPGRERLTAATAAVVEHVEGAHWLLGLLLVLDDEQLLVVHRATGRAYDVTISGVGDNFQLHTLLAATLIGDPARGLIPGTPPAPQHVAAATDGEDLQPAGGIRGHFNLVDADGAWIWNEGRPIDIPQFNGRRVVVIDPPPYMRTWDTGRLYPLMSPEIRLDRILPDAEAADWTAKVAPDRRSQ
jgi:hypothetical protein